MIGVGRKAIADRLAELDKTFEGLAAEYKRPVYSSLADVPADNQRPIVVQERDMDLPGASRLALRTLSKNRRGYFLMIEWDTHTDDPKRGLDNMVGFDTLIREIAGMVNLDETLLLFMADHSFELRSIGGRRGQPVLQGLDEWRTKNAGTRNPVDIPAMRVGRSHTGEEVIVAAQGPGSNQVRGFMPNTQLFHVMMKAWGWKPDGK